MLINGIEYSEPEIIAKFRMLSDEIVRLNEVLKRYEAENFTLQEKLDKLGEEYNEQTAVIGFLEDDNKRFDDENKELKRLLWKAVTTFNDASCNKDCRQCKWNNGGCEMSCRFSWIHTDEALKLIGGEKDE